MRKCCRFVAIVMLSGHIDKKFLRAFSRQKVPKGFLRTFMIVLCTLYQLNSLAFCSIRNQP